MHGQHKKHGHAIRLASTNGLSREEWLALRQRGIGSSDAAVAIGLSPYKSALTLWLEKTARKAPDDLSEKESVLWGQILEPVLASVYQERTGYKVRRVNAVLQHAEHTFMLANLDREIVGLPEGPGVLEIKTSGYHSAPQWEEGIPISYQCQVLHQLAVTGHDWADVAVLIAGQDFRIYRVTRDDDKIADLIARERAFWDCVIEQRQPDPDGSADAARALGWLYPQDNGLVVDLSESTEFNRLFESLLEARTAKAEAEAEEDRLKQQIQNALGPATTAQFQRGKVSWRRAKDGQVPDLERLQADYPKLMQRYVKPLPGARRFTVSTARNPS
ncbi:YqaJ viral recombinase family protein [Chitinimonas sp. BJYL2]|uniref:YqaJ viral recombinase family nuclease n=1 Tax=Chitinimonas sp. BJYL2 TaxID=2976696 RepID=UPI0022B2F384|nr:YqaJ viral recombinase family protein [Chitinimonas sp. BJYL2]